MDDEASVRIEIKGGAAPDMTSADAALRQLAVDAENEVAFVDSPDRAKRGMGQPRSLTFAKANILADQIAVRFLRRGLNTGDTIALQMPNTIEAPLLILGAWRAGLTVCLMPLLWRFDEINRAFSRLKPKAVVTVSRYGDEMSARTLGEAAAKNPSVRFVFAIGEDLPDGVTPIDDWMSEEGAEDRKTELLPEPAPLDQTALITWTVLQQAACPVPRTHGEVAALARMFSSHMKLGPGGRVLNTYPYSSIGAVAGQLVAPLLAGARTVLHLPFSFDVFVRQLQENEITYTALPAPVISALEERCDLGSSALPLARIGCIWPNPHGVDSGLDLFEPPLPVFDIHNFAELAVLVRERSSGTDPSLLPLGKIYLPGEEDTGDPVLEMRVRGAVIHKESHQVLKGTLCVSGRSVPPGPLQPAGAQDGTVIEADSHGFLDTGIGCAVDESFAGQFRCQKSENLIYHGGAVIAASELDKLYAEFPEFLDAAAFVLDDAVIGERIFAAVVPKPDIAPSLDRLREFLDQKRVAPYKTPDQLVIVKSIPRSGQGKVQRDQILAHI